MCLSQEEVWGEARDNFTEEVSFRDPKGNDKFIKHYRSGNIMCKRADTHSVSRHTQELFFTQSQELFPVGSWLRR